MGREIVQKLFHLAAVAALAGCAQPADPIAISSGISGPSANSRYEDSVSRVTVTGGQQTNPMWTSQIDNSAFQLALKSALESFGYFEFGGPFEVEANLLSIEQPLAGLNLTVITSVRYRIFGQDGRLLFDETVQASGTAGFSDAAIAVVRLKIANERSARNNISEFFTRLGSAPLSS